MYEDKINLMHDKNIKRSIKLKKIYIVRIAYQQLLITIYRFIVDNYKVSL